eukprot:CAMPEP_0172875460 /NCGR_PEP_ID=MMETSP1075-20121228/101690_1 /TAXON_ID=2916 /ORGANISM="Ceratium fusus, Strain PA161109" /LENGTH=64 /DNA_ID=CAMNT_0013726533 /DNA_START=99 /DNA_END=290 /DNA_ORIENTATION=-
MAGIECRTTAWFIVLVVVLVIAWVISMVVGYKRHQAWRNAPKGQDDVTGPENVGGDGFYTEDPA